MTIDDLMKQFASWMGIYGVPEFAKALAGSSTTLRALIWPCCGGLGDQAAATYTLSTLLAGMPASVIAEFSDPNFRAAYAVGNVSSALTASGSSTVSVTGQALKPDALVPTGVYSTQFVTPIGSSTVGSTLFQSRDAWFTRYVVAKTGTAQSSINFSGNLVIFKAVV